MASPSRSEKSFSPLPFSVLNTASRCGTGELENLLILLWQFWFGLFKANKYGLQSLSSPGHPECDKWTNATSESTATNEFKLTNPRQAGHFSNPPSQKTYGSQQACSVHIQPFPKGNCAPPLCKHKKEFSLSQFKTTHQSINSKDAHSPSYPTFFDTDGLICASSEFKPDKCITRRRCCFIKKPWS